jgi:hypothetical protein
VENVLRFYWAVRPRIEPVELFQNIRKGSNYGMQKIYMKKIQN